MDSQSDLAIQEEIGDEEFLSRREHLLFGERLIFVLDDDCDEAASEWEPGSNKSRMEAAADAVRLIMRRKLNATLKHTFAVASYNSHSQVTWREGFTSDFERLDQSLATLTSLVSSSAATSKEGGVETETDTQPGVRLTEVFTQLMSFIEQSVSTSDLARPETDTVPPVLTRFLFIYCRSGEVPVYNSTRPFFTAPANKTHFLDCLFLHHKLATHRDCAAACQDTLNILSLIQRGDPDEELEEGDDEENNFLFETHASNMRLMTFAALLCAHPAHREEQTDMLAKFNVNDSTLQDILEVDAEARREEGTRAAAALQAARGKRQQPSTTATVLATTLPTNSSASSTGGVSSSGRVALPAASSASNCTSNRKNPGDGASDTGMKMFGMTFGGGKSKKNNATQSGTTPHANNNNSSY